ncbi:MAG TPA: 16S rRNA (guanine(966)-N(2))-methyltransferase RsmD [Actinomycetes bacterium]|nr:16S rRNA (guanine(966)-N(2))-methyltransferase RsmD [Actinomycetes bacterium]
MTRIVAGAARGRRLAIPPGEGTRPTSDRAREALFSALGALIRAWAGRRVLDLYAGSGAVGLEALSRGAAGVVLVESDAKAARTITANVAAVGLPGAELRRTTAELAVRSLVASGGPPFDVVFADPPYDLGDDRLGEVLLAVRPALAPDAVVAVERSTRGGTWEWPAGYEALRSKRYGEATLWYGRAAPVPAPPDERQESPT